MSFTWQSLGLIIICGSLGSCSWANAVPNPTPDQLQEEQQSLGLRKQLKGLSALATTCKLHQPCYAMPCHASGVR